jgi:hypothetical protein
VLLETFLAQRRTATLCPDVLGTRTLWPLTDREGHCLARLQILEPYTVACGVVEEILRALRCGNESVSLVSHALDRAPVVSHIRLSEKIAGLSLEGFSTVARRRPMYPVWRDRRRRYIHPYVDTRKWRTRSASHLSVVATLFAADDRQGIGG